MKASKIFSISILSILVFSCKGQMNRKKDMESVAQTLLECLLNENSNRILEMYDTNYVNLNKTSVVNEIINTTKENISFIKKIKKNISMNEISSSVDSLSGARLVTISLIKDKNIDLNIWECNLVTVFFPEKFYRTKVDKFVNYKLVKKNIITKEEQKIKLSPN